MTYARVAVMACLALMAGCAEGSPVSGPWVDAEVSDTGPRDSDADAPAFRTDTACEVVRPGLLCEDFHRHNPTDPWPLDQYSILCDAGFLNFENCTVWSYDPNYYSTDTWAWCCIVPDAGPPPR